MRCANCGRQLSRPIFGLGFGLGLGGWYAKPWYYGGWHGWYPWYQGWYGWYHGGHHDWRNDQR